MAEQARLDYAPADNHDEHVEHVDSSDEVRAAEVPAQVKAEGEEARPYVYPEDPSKVEAAPPVDQPYTYPPTPAKSRLPEQPTNEGDPYAYTGNSDPI